MSEEWIGTSEASKRYEIAQRTIQQWATTKQIASKIQMAHTRAKGNGVKLVLVPDLERRIQEFKDQKAAPLTTQVITPTRTVNHKDSLRQTELAIRAYCEALGYPIDEKLLLTVLKAKAAKIHPMAEAFKKKRESMYVSHTYASLLTGLGASTVSEFESGKFHPSARSVAKIEKFLSGEIEVPMDDKSLRIRKNQWKCKG